jgi:hypothetical protein
VRTVWYVVGYVCLVWMSLYGIDYGLWLCEFAPFYGARVLGAILAATIIGAWFWHVVVSARRRDREYKGEQ